MINPDEIIRQLAVNVEAIRILLQSISEEQAQWKPNSETWSMKEVMEHVYNEERVDFRKHLKEMFSSPPQPWGPWHPEEYVPVENLRQAIEGFISERKDSITWIKGLGAPDWEIASRTVFGPEDEELVLRAGDVLVSWVAHDYLHIRQMNELLFAWNEKQGAPYSVQYAGGW